MKKIISISFAVIITISSGIICLYFYYKSKGQFHERHPKDYVSYQLIDYHTCQKSFHFENKKYALQSDNFEFPHYQGVQLYLAEKDLKKDYPLTCFLVEAGITPTSFTVIAAGNIDEKLNILYIDDQGNLGSPLCPKDR